LNLEFFAKKKRRAYDLHGTPDDWIQVSRPVNPEDLRDDLDETESFVDVDDPISPLRQWTVSWFRDAASRAVDMEGRLRTRQRRTLLEDVTLAALDAAKSAKSNLESSSNRAKNWARDKAHEALAEVLAHAYDRADRAIVAKQTPSTWRLGFGPAAAVVVDEFALDVLGPDGAPMCPPMTFTARTLADLDDHTAHVDDLKPARIILKFAFLLVESCVQELVDTRPADAARLAAVFARQVAHDTSNKTRRLLEEKAAAWLALDDNDRDARDDELALLRPDSRSDLTIPLPDPKLTADF